MILLFQNVPGYMRTADTQWMYGRWGVPEPDQAPHKCFILRGTLAADINDVREVIERELQADPK